jgi:hypothetical protein
MNNTLITQFCKWQKQLGKQAEIICFLSPHIFAIKLWGKLLFVTKLRKNDVDFMLKMITYFLNTLKTLDCTG